MTFTPPDYTGQQLQDNYEAVNADLIAFVQSGLADLATYVDAQLAPLLAAAAAKPTPANPVPAGKIAPFGFPSPAIPSSAYYLDPTGSDSGSGSSSNPWKTVEHAVSVVRAGDVVVLNGGGAPFASSDPKNPNSLFYSSAGTPAAHIKWISNPGKPRAQLARRQRMNGAYNEFWNLDIVGPTGVIGSTEDVLCWMDGGVWLVNCDVSKDAWHAGCFVGNTSIPTKILGCRIHHNGSMAAANSNVDHGIYWNVGGGVIAGTQLDHNFCHGIQVYPHANGVQLVYCTLADNGNTVGGTHGVGMMFASDGSAPITANCSLSKSIVARNVENGIRSSGSPASSNSASDNLVFGNGGGNFGAELGTPALVTSGIVQQDPLFIDPTNGNYDLQAGSPAIGKWGAYQNGADPTQYL